MDHMDQSNCSGRETQLEEEAAVLVCMKVDSSMLVSSKVRKQRQPQDLHVVDSSFMLFSVSPSSALCVQPSEALHLRARCQLSLS